MLMERLSLDYTLPDRTLMDPSLVCQLTEQSLKSTYFTFQGQIFKQLKGLAMGSPLSPVIANLFVEDFGNMALTTGLSAQRYVDDTFVIWPHGTKIFLHYINHLHENIEFTIEKEENSQIDGYPLAIKHFLNSLLTVCTI